MGKERRKICLVNLIFGSVTAWLVDRKSPPIIVATVEDPPTTCLCPFCKKGILPQAFLDDEFVLLTHYFLKGKCREKEIINDSIRVFWYTSRNGKYMWVCAMIVWVWV